MPINSENTKKLLDVVNAALDPEALRNKNPYAGGTYGDFIDELRGKAIDIHAQAAEKYVKSQPLDTDLKNLNPTQKTELAQYQHDALATYKNRITSLVQEAGGGTPAVHADASDSYLKNIAGSTLSGVFAGDPGAGFMSGVLGGIKDFIMSLPFVGNLIRQASIYVSAKFSGDEELKHMTWAEAGEQALLERDAEAFGNKLGVDAGVIARVLNNNQSIKQARFDALDGVHDGKLDISKINTDNDAAKLSLAELKMQQDGENSNVLEQFKEFVKDKGITFDASNNTFSPSAGATSFPASIDVSGNRR